MKNVLALLLLMIVSVNLSAQTNTPDTVFYFTPDGLTDYVIMNVPSKSAVDLYKKTIEWVAVTYKSPKDVILSQIENEYIRIEGVDKAMWAIKMLGLSDNVMCRYQIEISFKDNKYKFDVLKLESYTAPSQYAIGGWNNTPIDAGVKSMFDKNGNIRKLCLPQLQGIENSFNALNKSLLDFMTSNVIPSKKENW